MLKVKDYDILNTTCKGFYPLVESLNGFCNQEEGKSTSLELMSSKSTNFN